VRGAEALGQVCVTVRGAIGRLRSWPRTTGSIIVILVLVLVPLCEGYLVDG